MKRTASFKRAMIAIRRMMTEGKYAKALSAVDELLLEWEDQPALLVLRGELIQLQEEGGPSLEDAAATLKRATTLDERNGDTWLEFGHFQFAVDDDAKAAEKSFQRAVAASSETLISALLGRAGALEEIGRKREAFDCLSIAKYLHSSVKSNNGAASYEGSLYERWESLVGDM